MNITIFTLILLAVVFNTVAQLVFKIGMGQIGTFIFHWSNFIPIILKVIASPWIIIGIFIYVGSVGVWLMVLSRTQVSIAYPLSSLAYVTSAIAAYYLLGEDLSIIRIVGIAVILLGVYMVARS
ncbi:MAG: quaternary ammonium compound-resistance protein [uncultured bacterium]|nr:MAG: quaternary ammonium compound-resistance protein [uncultured bacterium]